MFYMNPNSKPPKNIDVFKALKYLLSFLTIAILIKYLPTSTPLIAYVFAFGHILYTLYKFISLLD